MLPNTQVLKINLTGDVLWQIWGWGTSNPGNEVGARRTSNKELVSFVYFWHFVLSKIISRITDLANYIPAVMVMQGGPQKNHVQSCIIA